MFENLFWALGYDEDQEEIEACPKSKSQKYLVLKQIRDSHIKLKKRPIKKKIKWKKATII